MTTTPLPPLPDASNSNFPSGRAGFRAPYGPAYTADQMHAYARQSRADLEAENQRLRKIAWLIGSIFVHGNFKAETHNERELEKLLRENGTFWESLADFDVRAALEKQP